MLPHHHYQYHWFIQPTLYGKACPSASASTCVLRSFECIGVICDYLRLRCDRKVYCSFVYVHVYSKPTSRVCNINTALIETLLPFANTIFRFFRVLFKLTLPQRTRRTMSVERKRAIRVRDTCPRGSATRHGHANLAGQKPGANSKAVLASSC
jgi:hypothetical protein